MLPKMISQRLRRFCREDGGYAPVEYALSSVVFLFLIGGLFTYYDVFHQNVQAQKANYAIADTLSRQTDPVDEAYLTNTLGLFRLINGGENGQTALRVSVVTYDADGNNWQRVWSTGLGLMPPLTNATLDQMRDNLPGAIDGEELILVESWEDYRPRFANVAPPMTLSTFSFTRPRYAPQLPLEDASGAIISSLRTPGLVDIGGVGLHLANPLDAL